MSRIFYKIIKILWLGFFITILPMDGFSQDTLKTTTDYFNAGAYNYLNNKSTAALKLVQKGLAIDSTDEKLKKLAELILKKDKDQQQQNKQDQNQNKDDNQDKKDQDKNKDQDKQNNEDNQDKEEQQQNNQLTKQDAERMLDALNNKDKNLQDELKEEKAKAVNVQVEKDW